MQMGREKKESTMFRVRHATAFTGQVNASRSGEFNTTARSETTTTSSLSTSVSTHVSASAPSSKLLRTTAIGISGRRSSSGSLCLAFTWEGDNAEDEDETLATSPNASGRDFVGGRDFVRVRKTVEACARLCEDVAIHVTGNSKAFSGC